MKNWPDNITGNVTITGTSDTSSGGTYTITLDPSVLSGSSGAVLISNGGTSSWAWENPSDPFENGFPDWQDFKDMCDEYPALKTAYEHMKVFYKMSVDDWESKKKGNENV